MAHICISEQKERQRGYQKAHYRAHRELLLAKSREWYERNREKVNERARRRYHAHKEECRIRNTRWQQTSPKRKQWKEANRERLNEYWRKYYHEHPERKAYLKEWNTRSPRRLSLLCKWEKVGHVCYICGLDLLRGEITADHVHPRKHGGTEVDSNIMPAHSVCNSRKNCRINFPVARPELIEVANG